jgi:hypothetical protein
MTKERLRDDKILRIHLDDGELIFVDVNVNNDLWKKILSQKEKIVKVVSNEWEWNLLTGEVIFH